MLRYGWPNDLRFRQALSELNKYLIILIEKNRRTTDEDINETLAILEPQTTDVKMTIHYAIKPFLEIFPLIGVQPNLFGMDKSNITTQINPEILIQLSRLMCFASFCQTQANSKIYITLSCTRQLLELSMAFKSTSHARESVFLYADDTFERMKLKDFVYDTAYLILAYTKQLKGIFDVDRYADDTICLRLMVLL